MVDTGESSDLREVLSEGPARRSRGQSLAGVLAKSILQALNLGAVESAVQRLTTVWDLTCRTENIMSSFAAQFARLNGKFGGPPSLSSNPV